MAHTLVEVFFVGVLVVLSVIDIRTRRLPNRIVLPAAAVVFAAQVALEPERALEWTLAALGAFGVLFVLAAINPAGLGMGDVKLALLLGAALGWQVLGALVLGFVLAAGAGVVMIVRGGWAARKNTLPLGPCLAAGGILVLFLP